MEVFEKFRVVVVVVGGGGVVTIQSAKSKS